MSVIEVQSLGFSYADREALRGVTFSVQEGQIFGLLGPNGGGKTTLFRILSTVLKFETGKVTVKGWDVLADPFEVRRITGIAFQSNSLDIQLTAFENLLHQGHLHGLKGAVLKSRAEELLHYFGLFDRRHELLKKFSGGLLRRVELAKALLHGPAVLLLDEPTAGLDPVASIDFWRYLKALRDQQGKTILLTTHSMEEAERCDCLGILSEGQIVSSGSPQELKSDIGTEVVAISTTQPEELVEDLRQTFDLEAWIMEGVVRIEHPDGHKLVARLIESFPGLVDSVTVGKPTLEDVFIHQTGHRFQDDAAADEKGR
jgi:ABC-2 type transport system ATP-binding protein